jgi:hypothetical protein
MTDSADGKAPGGAQPESSYVFLVRLWAEEDTSGAPAWCGKVQHVTSGEAHTFRDWPALVAQLRAMLPGPEAAPDPRVAAGPTDGHRPPAA